MDQNTLTHILNMKNMRKISKNLKNMKNIPKNLKNYRKLNTKTISNTSPNPELTDQPKAFLRAKFLYKCKSGFGK